MDRVVENQTLSDIILPEIGVTILASGTYDLAYKAAQLQVGSATLITELQNDNLRLIKSTEPTVYYTANEAQRIFEGFDDIILAGGQNNETLIIDPVIGPVWSRSLAFGQIKDFADVLIFGSTGFIRDRFLDDATTNASSNKTTPIALGNGQIVHVSIVTDKNPVNTTIVQLIKNAQFGGNGIHAGGTQIGSDLETTSGNLCDVFLNLAGYTFAANDRISVYLKKGNSGEGTASNPAVRVYVRYD